MKKTSLRLLAVFAAFVSCAVARAEIKALPDGTWTFEDFVDGVGDAGPAADQVLGTEGADGDENENREFHG